MSVRPNFEILSDRRRFLTLYRPAEGRFDLHTVTFPETDTHDERLRDSRKALGLKVPNDALGQAVGRKIRSVFHSDILSQKECSLPETPVSTRQNPYHHGFHQFPLAPCQTQAN